ncbi:hypothetical protein LGW31_09930 [Streptococcus mutans]|nr:hypothetical protein [Streptococcus mutans]
MKKRKVLSAIIVIMVLLVSIATTLTTQDVYGSTFGQKSQRSSSITSVKFGKISKFSDYLIKAKHSKSKAKKHESSKSKKVYSDNYIQVTKTGGTLTFKNVSGQDIKLDGNGIFDNEIEINISSLGDIGDIKSGGSKSVVISSVDLQGQSREGDKESGETFAGDKLYKHIMKTGETLTWSGTIEDSEYNDLASISFSFQY